MIIELIIALLLGCTIGTFTGLLPGIHINLIASFLVSSLPFFLSFASPLTLVVFIVSMSITHTFLDFIPSIFLGAPDEDSVLSILPGHEMLNQGKGYLAIILTLYGSILGIIIILLLTPLFIFLLPFIYKYLKIVMFFILLSSSVYLFAREKNFKLAIIIFFFSGFLGLSTLNLNLKESLLPLLSGLFGSSSLFFSLLKKQKIPEQKIIKLEEIKIRKYLLSPAVSALLSAPLCSFLPALGSGQAAVIGSDLSGEKDRKKFLVLIGSINTIVMGLSFLALYSIQEARTGSAVAVSRILTNFSFSSLLIILAAIIISGFLTFILTIFISKIFARNIPRINYKYLSISVLIFLAIVVFIFSGFLGFLLFIISTFTGLTCILLGVRRTFLMGSLMLPSILFYLPL